MNYTAWGNCFGRG